jgi:hypothetical protein
LLQRVPPTGWLGRAVDRRAAVETVLEAQTPRDLRGPLGARRQRARRRRTRRSRSRFRAGRDRPPRTCYSKASPPDSRRVTRPPYPSSRKQSRGCTTSRVCGGRC